MSKLMTEYMLRDVSAAHAMNFCALRYFNVAGADPEGRTGQSTAGATHRLKVAVEAALGKRSHGSVFGRDFDTQGGTALGRASRMERGGQLGKRSVVADTLKIKNKP